MVPESVRVRTAQPIRQEIAGKTRTIHVTLSTARLVVLYSGGRRLALKINAHLETAVCCSMRTAARPGYVGESMGGKFVTMSTH